MSPTTKRYHTLSIIFSILSFLLTVGPIIYYVITGFIEADLTSEKVGLTALVISALILVVINAVMKFNIRSTIWLIVIGVYLCLDNIMPLLLMVACGTILDEFIISPLCKSFKEKYTINKEIDERL